MKCRIIIFSIFLIFLVGCEKSKENTETTKMQEAAKISRNGSDQFEYYKLYGNVKSFTKYECSIIQKPKEIIEDRCQKISTINFNKDGNAIEEINYGFYDEFSVKDEDGKPIKNIDYGETQITTKIEYDNRGYKVSIVSIDSETNKKHIASVERKIATNSIVIYWNLNGDATDKSTVTYDDNNHLTSIKNEYKKSDFESVHKTIFEYEDNSGLPKKIVEHNGHFRIIRIYKYDKNGNIIAEHVKDNKYSGRKNILKTFDIYEQDGLNWTKRLVYWENVEKNATDKKSYPVVFEKREIQYYD